MMVNTHKNEISINTTYLSLLSIQVTTVTRKTSITTFSKGLERKEKTTTP